MAQVLIIQQMSGTRGGGEPWPPYGTIITVGDAEAGELAAAGIGEIIAEKPKPGRPRKVETVAVAEDLADGDA